MLVSALLITFIFPASANASQPINLALKPFIVQAVIDSAQIVGLPSSKAAKAHARKIQTLDPMLQQVMTYMPEPVSTRRLFFRKYFQPSDV